MGRIRWGAVGATLFLFAAGVMALEPGAARWSIKTSIPEGVDLEHPVLVPLADLIDADKLPPAPAVTNDDARFEHTRIPKFSNALGVAEGNILSTVGWLHLVAAEEDGGYHIQLSPAHDLEQGTSVLVVEVPSPDPALVSDSWLRERFEEVRSLIRERMLRGQEPSVRGSVLTHPACVEVAGQLFYDAPHIGDEARGKKGMKAATLWELHPVTRIAFSRGCTS